MHPIRHNYRRGKRQQQNNPKTPNGDATVGKESAASRPDSRAYLLDSRSAEDVDVVVDVFLLGNRSQRQATSTLPFPFHFAMPTGSFGKRPNKKRQKRPVKDLDDDPPDFSCVVAQSTSSGIILLFRKVKLNSRRSHYIVRNEIFVFTTLVAQSLLSDDAQHGGCHAGILRERCGDRCHDGHLGLVHSAVSVVRRCAMHCV